MAGRPDPVPVQEPLVLISQMQRSGGTLLLRLLDGHPECHVAPFQLRGIDETAKRRSTDPEEVWQTLHDPKLERRYREGYRQVKHDVLRDREVFSFRLPPDVHRAIYERCVASRAALSTRDLVDCYFTAFFNGWLDYENLGPGPKRWVVGFEPAVPAKKLGRRALRGLYPDGRVVSIVRDPWTWYASARRWEPRWRDRERALDDWCDVAIGTLRWKKTAQDALVILTFEELVSRTEETMRALAGRLGIDYLPGLLVPTFNGRPIGANTSFADVATEVSTKPLERAERELGDDDAAYITERAGNLYAEMLTVMKRDRPETGQ